VSTPPDAEIARSVPCRPIEEIGAKLGLGAAELHLHGRDIAKVDLGVLERSCTCTGGTSPRWTWACWSGRARVPGIRA